MSSSNRVPPNGSPVQGSRTRADGVVVAVTVALVGAAVVVGQVLISRGVDVKAPAAPLFATWQPHAGPGTPAAVVVAALVVLLGPRVASRLAWPALLALAGAASLAWTTSLALSRGWTGGVLDLVSDGSEYLSEVPTAPPLGELLATFVDRVPADAAMSWSTHTAGHPPGALLFFVGLDAAGLGGPGWAGAASLVAVSSVPVAVAVALASLAGRRWARTALPFAVLTPGVVAATSGDAVFAAFAAWGLALLVLATARRAGRLSPCALGLASGLLLGACLLLSYGLLLLALPAAAVVLHRRAWVVGALTATTTVAVVLAAAAGGFVWWEGLDAVRDRYAAGFGGIRPYGYWVWANLAALVLSTGPAVAVAVRRLAARPSSAPGVAGLVGGVLAALAVADLTGLSKAETERIWLPWSLWLPAACALLPLRDHRWWLGGQAVVALAVEHLTDAPW